VIVYGSPFSVTPVEIMVPVIGSSLSASGVGIAEEKPLSVKATKRSLRSFMMC
jgi:hypothetical protein